MNNISSHRERIIRVMRLIITISISSTTVSRLRSCRRLESIRFHKISFIRRVRQARRNPPWARSASRRRSNWKRLLIDSRLHIPVYLWTVQYSDSRENRLVLVRCLICILWAWRSSYVDSSSFHVVLSLIGIFAAYFDEALGAFAGFVVAKIFVLIHDFRRLFQK